jgi:predicted amidophosphoribosyltransferase
VGPAIANLMVRSLRSLGPCAVSRLPWNVAGQRCSARIGACLMANSEGESVGGVFVMKQGGRVDNFRILLLDVVMMTGATLDACLRALCEAVASSVIALTVARDVRPACPAGQVSNRKGAR